MRRPLSRCPALLLTALLLGPVAAHAQEVDPVFAGGVQAFEEARYEDAARLLRRAGRRNAEAYYLLARIYLETPLQDDRHAREAILKALDLDPDNVRYLDLRLRQYRADATNHATYAEQLSTRKHLAKAILEHDPDHALALLEMGRVAVDTYEWNLYGTAQFRNKGYFERKKADAFSEAETYLRHALDAERQRPDAYALLMKLYVLDGTFAEALSMLGSMQAHRPEDPYTWLYLGLAHHELGHATEAARSFEQALVRMPPDLHAVFTDLSYVLNDAQILDYEKDPAGYAAAFWMRRDARFLTPENERHNAHMARMTTAEILFGDAWQGVHGWETERGHTLIRYGKPRNAPYALLRYVPIMQETFSSGATFDTRRMATWVYDDFSLQFEDMVRNGLYIYFDESEIEARMQRRDNPERYAHEEPGRRVAFPYLASAFKGDHGQADVYVPYGIPLHDYDPTIPYADLTLRTGAFLITSSGQIESQRRTEHGLSSAQVVSFDDTHLWVGLHHLAAQAGEQELAVEFETEDRTTLGYQRTPLTVPDFTGDSLRVSDILLAYSVEEGGLDEHEYVVRHGLSIRPAPWAIFGTQQPLYLYFEVYNLAQDATGTTTYNVEAVLTPWDEAGGLKKLLRGVFGRKPQQGVALSFTGTGSTRDDEQYLILDATDQPPGRYVLALQVYDTVTGQRAETTREVFLEDR